MILRALFKKHRDRADERWFAMMEQAMLCLLYTSPSPRD